MIVSAPPMDPPTVLEGLSDAAKVVLLDYAAQPKLWELWYRYVQQWRHQGEKGIKEIPLPCFQLRDTVESPKNMHSRQSAGANIAK
jgi:hypothetical protein